VWSSPLILVGRFLVNVSDRPIANPVVVLREEFDDWAVLFNPDDAAAVGTNPVGVAVWKRMDGTRTLERIVAEIREEFRDTPDTMPDEITRFVEQLAGVGFVGFQAP
jgi:SynChlorMet cassette protein ScmD